MAGGQGLLNEVGPDEPGATRDQKSHPGDRPLAGEEWQPGPWGWAGQVTVFPIDPMSKRRILAGR